MALRFQYQELTAAYIFQYHEDFIPRAIDFLTR